MIFAKNTILSENNKTMDAAIDSHCEPLSKNVVVARTQKHFHRFTVQTEVLALLTFRFKIGLP